MKKKIIYSLIAIIVIVGIWAAFNPQKAVQGVVNFGMWATSWKKHRDPSKETAAFALSADELSKAFAANKDEATKKYINQSVLVDGAVTATQGVTVSLNNVACNIDSTETSRIGALKTGDKIKVQGLVVGYDDLLDEIKVAQCVIK